MAKYNLKKSHLKKVFLFLLIIFLLSGTFLRFYKLSDQSWWIDEAYSINAAVSTIEKGKPILDSGWYYEGQLPYTHVLAASIKAFGLNSFATRIPAVVFNLLFLIVFFEFVRRFFGMWPALITTFFLTFSYWEIAWARQARNYTLFQLFFWVAIYFYWRFINEKYRLIHLILSLIAGIFAIYTHILGLLLIPVFALTFLFYEKFSIRNLKKIFKGKKLIVFLITFLTLIFLGFVYSQFKENIFYNIKNINVRDNYLLFAIDNFGILIVFSILAIFFQFFIKKKTRNLRKYALLFSYYVIFLVLVSLYAPNPGHRYLFAVIPVLYLLGSVFIVDFLNFFKSKKYLFLSLISLGLILYFSKFQFFPQVNYYLESDPSRMQLIESGKLPYNYYIYAPQPEWNAAYNYVENHVGYHDRVISAQPVFNLLYLGTKEAWISYALNVSDKRPQKDLYANAETIYSLQDLRNFTVKNSGFIILDYLSIDGRIPEEILNYIEENFELVWEKYTNPWSVIWIYRF